MALIGEADHLGYFGRRRAQPKQLPRPAQSQLPLIGMRRQPDRRAEGSDKIHGIELDQPGKIGKGNTPVVVGFQKFANGRDVPRLAACFDPCVRLPGVSGQRREPARQQRLGFKSVIVSFEISMRFAKALEKLEVAKA